MREYSLFLKDILHAVEKIDCFIGSMNYEEFAEDDKTLSAVVRKLEIIGEAVKQLPESYIQQCPLIPWKQISGMRDKLIHCYFGVDSNLVWQTVHNRLPELKHAIIFMLENKPNTH